MDERHQLARREEHAAAVRGAVDEIAFEIDSFVISDEHQLVAVRTAEVRERATDLLHDPLSAFRVRRCGRYPDHYRKERIGSLLETESRKLRCVEKERSAFSICK